MAQLGIATLAQRTSADFQVLVLELPERLLGGLELTMCNTKYDVHAMSVPVVLLQSYIYVFGWCATI